jgi:hypothetical protein
VRAPAWVVDAGAPGVRGVPLRGPPGAVAVAEDAAAVVSEADAVAEDAAAAAAQGQLEELLRGPGAGALRPTPRPPRTPSPDEPFAGVAALIHRWQQNVAAHAPGWGPVGAPSCPPRA